MKDVQVQVRKAISMVGQPGLLLALALVILAAVGWLNYYDMIRDFLSWFLELDFEEEMLN